MPTGFASMTNGQAPAKTSTLLTGGRAEWLIWARTGSGGGSTLASALGGVILPGSCKVTNGKPCRNGLVYIDSTYM